MPALAPIAIDDGAATPVTHTFAPVSTDGSAADLANRSATIPQGFETLQVEVQRPKTATGSYRVTAKLVLPTVAAVNGLDTVVRQSQVTLSFNVSQVSTAAERKNLRVLCANLLNNTLMTTVIENLEPIY